MNASGAGETGDAAVTVVCYPVSRNSAYAPLLFTGIEARYRPAYVESGAALRAALDERDGGDRAIVHVHWEEFVLRECASEGEADAAVAEFCQTLAAIRERGAALVWTVHNEVPHVIARPRPFLAMRRALAAAADAILVHDERATGVVAAQLETAGRGGLNRAKVRVLPHPSYLDRLEDAAALEAGLARPFERVIAGFGWIRRQKGFGEMIGMLPPAFLRSHGARIRISGGDAEAAAVMAQHPRRADVEWDVRHVPDAETPALLRSAACLVLPYERALTSGVVLLAMSVGALIVAADVPALRDVLPPANRRFLYAPGDGASLRAAVDAAFALTAPERRDILRANLEAARERHPACIARRLAAIYDEVRGTSRAPAERPGRTP